MTILTGCMNSKDNSKIMRLRCDVKKFLSENLERMYWSTYDITLEYWSSTNVYGEIETMTSLNTKY